MRIDGFLRTPIRGEHQNRLQNLQVAECALMGTPAPTDPYPQTLEISFHVMADVSEVQISPLWEGVLQFIPDSTANNPKDPAQVTKANFPGWSVTGDLILRTWHGLEKAFATHIAFISPPPSTIRYSKIQLTREFLFTTLDQLPRAQLVVDGKKLDQSNPLFHPNLVIKFLQGLAGVYCNLDPNDPVKDFSHKPMPSVKLEAAGTTTVLRVAASSLANEALSPTWFDQRPEYDDISGEQLVDPALRQFKHQLRNPSHPSHSAIPVWAIFQAAADTAYAPDNSPTAPVRAALSAPRQDGKTCRRINLIRPPVPGKPVDADPRRPFPMYQLCWRPVGGGALESLRIPLSGQVYLPLADGDYTFWVIPRSQDPQVATPGEQFKLSEKSAVVQYIGLPQAAIDVALESVNTATVYAHLQEFDAKFVWEGIRIVQNEREKHKRKAENDWNVDVHDWYDVRTPFAPIYGYIRESAGRHGLAPEFLQAVFMGEGANLAIEDRASFDANEVLDAYGFVGLDLILYRLGKIPTGKPPYPPELDPADPNDAEEIAEYLFDLQANGYVDSATAALVSYDREVVRIEAGGQRTLQVARVTGWSNAIELVAAELQARLDEMLAYCSSKVPPIPITEEIQRRYLAYVRYNASFGTAKQHADNLPSRILQWTDARPDHNLDARYNTLQRIAVAQWYEDAGFYR
ncbi:MAG: hypothetical protein JXA14_22805 [Anaerolineae bacterium]|nr:hypothetical protein [Anaerolineae bacterium]